MNKKGSAELYIFLVIAILALLGSIYTIRSPTGAIVEEPECPECLNIIPNENCDNQIDDNCDGLTDSEDPNCKQPPGGGGGGGATRTFQETCCTPCHDNPKEECEGRISLGDNNCHQTTDNKCKTTEEIIATETKEAELPTKITKEETFINVPNTRPAIQVEAPARIITESSRKTTAQYAKKPTTNLALAGTLLIVIITAAVMLIKRLKPEQIKNPFKRGGRK